MNFTEPYKIVACPICLDANLSLCKPCSWRNLHSHTTGMGPDGPHSGIRVQPHQEASHQDTTQGNVILLSRHDSDNPVKDTIRLPVAEKPTDSQVRDLQRYFGEMPIDEILAGLKFARNRWSAKDAGTLKVGRKSIIQKEVHSVTAEQARWRLKNWKIMIANYRRRGYSYPTIFRIKKALIQRSGDPPPP